MHLFHIFLFIKSYFSLLSLYSNSPLILFFFFFNDTAPTDFSPFPPHAVLPISPRQFLRPSRLVDPNRRQRGGGIDAQRAKALPKHLAALAEGRGGHRFELAGKAGEGSAPR